MHLPAPSTVCSNYRSNFGLKLLKAFTGLVFDSRRPTNIDAKLCMQFGIFLELPRVCEGSCGFLRTSMFGRVARKRLFLLSPGHFSLRPRHPEVARSPQSPRLTSLYINELRADESSGLFLTSAGDGNRPDSESGE